MQKKLTKKEMDQANRMKSNFAQIRGEISEVQSMIENLNLRAGTLIKELELLRDKETEFMNALSKKYGQGKLNPFTLEYETN
jgi:hypothetical protein